MSKPIHIKMRPFKVGDRVWSFQYGEGFVVEITEDNDYPVAIEYTTYTQKGMHTDTSSFPTLFHYDTAVELGFVGMTVEIVEPKELEGLGVGDTIYMNSGKFGIKEFKITYSDGTYKWAVDEHNGITPRSYSLCFHVRGDLVFPDYKDTGIKAYSTRERAEKHGRGDA